MDSSCYLYRLVAEVRRLQWRGKHLQVSAATGSFISGAVIGRPARAASGRKVHFGSQSEL